MSHGRMSEWKPLNHKTDLGIDAGLEGTWPAGDTDQQEADGTLARGLPSRRYLNVRHLDSIRCRNHKVRWERYPSEVRCERVPADSLRYRERPRGSDPVLLREVKVEVVGAPVLLQQAQAVVASDLKRFVQYSEAVGDRVPSRRDGTGCARLHVLTHSGCEWPCQHFPLFLV